MKIVITDGFALNPGDLSWKAFGALGEVEYYDRTPPEQIPDRCKDASVIVTNKTPVTDAVMSTAKDLKIIAVTATGYNIVDVEAARRRNIVVCNVPEYGTWSVAQHTIAMMLELTNRVGLHSKSVAEGEWSASKDWSYARSPVIELKDKVLGIVGLGRIGSQTARVSMALGMQVIFYRGQALPDAKPATLEELFANSDFVSLHCPLRPDNYGFVNRSLLASMKKTSFLINTSRGQLINEGELAQALRDGVIAGAALDVLSEEPPAPGNPLLSAPNCVITPHNAWLSFEARERIMRTTFENIRSALAGRPQNVV